MVVLLSVIVAACGATPEEEEEEEEEPIAEEEEQEPIAEEEEQEPIAEEEEQEPIRIGLPIGLTGVFGDIGEALMRGYEVALEVYGGEVRGRPVEFVHEETGFDPTTAVTKSESLARQDVVAIVGPVLSHEGLAVNAVADRIAIPIVQTNTGAIDITGAECNPWVFRTAPSDAFSVNALAAWLEANPDFEDRRWGVVAADYAWGHSYVDEVERLLGDNLVRSDLYPLDTTDWSAAITRMQEADAEVVVAVVPIGTPFLGFLDQADTFGLKEQATLVAPIGVPEPHIDQLGDRAEGIKVIAAWGSWAYEDRSPLLAEFNERYFDNYGETPHLLSVNSGSGFYMLLEALEQAESLEPHDVAEALRSVTVETPLGTYSVRPDDQQGMVPVFSGEIEKLDEPRYGAEYAFVPDRFFEGQVVAPPVTCEFD